MPGKIIIVTGASSRFGRLSANALAQSGYTVYAAMREVSGRNARHAKDARAYARQQGVDLRVIDLDVCAQASVDAAVATIAARHGRIDVVVHGAGRMAFGPAEAFTPEQLAQLYDVNVLSAQRVNRAVLPQMRSQRQGLLVWVSCSSVAGGMTPYVAAHLVAKAGLDVLAVQYARELSRWGVETSIIVPGAFAAGADHVAHDTPADDARAAEYDDGPYAGMPRQIQDANAGIIPEDANPGAVAGAIASVVDAPFGQRPFRVHVDPGGDGGSVAFSVIDRIRDEMLNRIGLSDLLKPTAHMHPGLP